MYKQREKNYVSKFRKSWNFQSPAFVFRQVEHKLIHFVHGHCVQKLINFFFGEKVPCNIEHGSPVLKSRLVFDDADRKFISAIAHAAQSLVSIKGACCSSDRYFDGEFGDFNPIGLVMSFVLVQDVKIVYFRNHNVFSTWFCILDSSAKMI